MNPLPFLTPCNICVVGPTMSGKTYFVMKLLNSLDFAFSVKPKKLLYCYCEWQDKFDAIQESLPGMEFHQGLPAESFIDRWSTNDGDKENTGGLIVLDDLMSTVCSSLDIVHLFTIKCHHRNITTILLNQSLFPPGKHSKTLSLNCNYFILFRNFRDTRQVSMFGSQLFPRKLAYFMDSYEKATQTAYGYLCVDLHPKSDRTYQLRSNILKDSSGPPIVYVPKV